MTNRSLSMTTNGIATREEETPTFETALERIREIVGLLESGDLTLEESMAKYQEASGLIEQSRKLIADAELRINELTREVDADH
jgi:exodeoxyribonuclease VII small subunit